MESKPSSSTSIQGSQQCRRFEFPEIQLATNNFDESLVIAHGGFGKVYKGNVINGSSLCGVAIKRLDSMSNQGATEFWTEVEMLSKLRHSNLVSLIGYCNYEKEMILVYEYMPMEHLKINLHKHWYPSSWLTTTQYLHFGLSKISPTNQTSTYVETLVKGTFGYLDPDYYATGKLTRKSDVYAFGVVLLEVLCRKRAVDSSLDEEQWNLARWAHESIEEGKLKHIIDPDIRGQISPKCLKEFVRLTERCLHNNLKQRSSMAAVVEGLESLVNLQEKFNNSLQPTRQTIFGKLANMIPFPSNRENSDRTSWPLHMFNQIYLKFFGTTSLPALVDGEGKGSLKEFKFADLERATSNFDKGSILGEGGFGRVFLGWVDKDTFIPSQHGDGIPIAVKRLDENGLQGISEWQAEVSFLGKLAHPNIINLMGYCIERESFLLVYEYMQNRSFDHFLFTNVKPLSWGTRLTIMIGVARGLTYLHSSKPQVIWRGFKSSDILLDQDFNPKLGDFGLAKLGPGTGETHVTTMVMGTYGYAAPEYIATGHLYVKSDIYGFGVIMLETLTGLRALDTKRPKEQVILVEWAKPALASRKRLKRIIDTRLNHNYPKEAAFKYAELTLRCLECEPRRRPSSEEVLQSLEQIYAIKKVKRGKIETQTNECAFRLSSSLDSRAILLNPTAPREEFSLQNFREFGSSWPNKSSIHLCRDNDKGTYGYQDPNYYTTRNLTRNSDV
ncbi:hypothetical protein OSB04_014935 [Centaurea solstitialis]|uniref:non-specific serine/threonine protein kinase n=1 Tax=Centaurea solstitialis TaxID=347529 RepID=A0AA38SY08_9ASTR|nr:hypothetical protein OSB04_014935 [Centaurea solstitialis]